jgi:hypothetical protein
VLTYFAGPTDFGLVAKEGTESCVLASGGANCGLAATDASGATKTGSVFMQTEIRTLALASSAPTAPGGTASANGSGLRAVPSLSIAMFLGMGLLAFTL